LNGVGVKDGRISIVCAGGGAETIRINPDAIKPTKTPRKIPCQSFNEAFLQITRK